MQKLNCFEKTLCSILKGGKIPKHIGFIMDGNRRHAKKMNLGEPIKGHEEGLRSLKKCLLFCKQLKISMVSLFCFSIENFKRSQEEVEGLMGLFLSTFDQCSSLSSYLQQQKIRVKIIGNIKLFRQDIQECIRKVEERTQHYDEMVINMCFGYDSLWEAQKSIRKMRTSSFKNLMENLEITMPLDILVRTANEKRLSNFMLPQCAYCSICILKEHWPQMSISSFIKLIIEYNYYYRQIQKQKHIYQLMLSEPECKIIESQEQQNDLLPEKNRKQE